MYQERPSKIMGLKDEYTSFCFDEACAYIISKLKDGEKPIFKREYSSFSELYAQFES